VLYHLFKNGDEKAFEALYLRYSAEIFNYALKLLGNRDLAEDVLEETFIRLFQSNLSETGKLKNWLYRVATNLSYKSMRKRKYEIETSETTLEHLKRSPPDDRIILNIQVRGTLMKIPEKQRTVVVLKFYQGMKYREIADLLGCPLGTVKTRMHEGLKKLRSILRRDLS
jgi:RNA polymerase sigma-70 factor (ECF subfamily)